MAIARRREVEIRYVIPFGGTAQRKVALRLRYQDPGSCGEVCDGGIVVGYSDLRRLLGPDKQRNGFVRPGVWWLSYESYPKMVLRVVRRVEQPPVVPKH